jgi:uncharacterized delta-60 repeat protein
VILVQIWASSEGDLAAWPDGSSDGSFGTDAHVYASFGGNGNADWAHDLALQPDGRLVAVGSCDAGGFALARFEADGALDRSFGDRGIIRLESTSWGVRLSEARAVTLQSNGETVVPGVAVTGFVAFVMTRFHPDGSLDVAFDSAVVNRFRQAWPTATDADLRTAMLQSGYQPTWFGSAGVANDLALQDDGAIVVAGRLEGDFAVARFRPNASWTRASGRAAG